MSEPSPAGQKVALPIWRQLRWSLILSFIGIAVIPLLIVTPAMLNRIEGQTIAQVTQQLESVADLKTSLLRRWIDDAILTMRFLRMQSVNTQLAGLLGGSSSPSDQAEVEQLLADALQAQTSTQAGTLHFERFFVYNREGQILAASDPALVGRVVARQPYFAASLQDVVVQAPFYAVGDQELTMVIAMPVTDQAGQVVGALAAEPDLAVLSQIMLDRSGLGETGETYLVSLESNYMLTQSRFEGYPQNRAYYSDGITRSLRGEDGSGVYDSYQSPPVPVIGVYRWIPPLNAALLAEISRSEALAISAGTAQLADLERTSDEARQALAELQETLRERDELSANIRELSSPVIPVMEGVLVLPLIGAIDSQRAALLTGTLLEQIEHHRADIAIIDVTGVPIIDTQVARVLLEAAAAARLVGAQPILVGVRPELAQTIVSLGLDLSELTTLADLQSGVRYAMARQARKY